MKLRDIDMTESIKTTRKGPPNRMNDLAYKDWMKFQKSFFRYQGDSHLVQEFILFFTKSVWDDGKASKSIVGGYGLDNLSVGKRNITFIGKYNSLVEVIKQLKDCENRNEKFDFAFIDLREIIRTTEDVETFLSETGQHFLITLRSIMVDNKYCCLILRDKPEDGKSVFPISWSIALSSRNHFKLRDEKIALVGPDSIFYCIILQATDDGRPATVISPMELCCSKLDKNIMTWIIPKPPRRKKNEILHPAKFPETLISEFIKIFSKPGDTVFDPMVGTGSTVLAAIQENRDALGMDLNEEFIAISKHRVEEYQSPMLFPDMENKNQAELFVGDANRINEYKLLEKKQFDYVITSPPYWSMLGNIGSEYQEQRRKKNLMLTYSDMKEDIGNIASYDNFLHTLSRIYTNVGNKMRKGSVLTVVLKNVKREHTLYTLPWDLVAQLCNTQGLFIYRGTTLWCQDDISLKPFAVGIHWVSNILHHYCIHLEKR